jgi:hypothetical protein
MITSVSILLVKVNDRPISGAKETHTVSLNTDCMRAGMIGMLTRVRLEAINVQSQSTSFTSIKLQTAWTGTLLTPSRLLETAICSCSDNAL